MSLSALAPKAGVEFLGTFLLCFTIAVAAGQGQILAGLAIGCTLMAAIYAGGHISGANYNPAVSVALLVRGALMPLDCAVYVASQCLGATAAAGLALPIAKFAGFSPIGHPAIAPDTTSGSLIAEIVLTFALCHVVIHTATTSFADGKWYYGLSIGFTVVSGAISVGGVSGGAFNPAVSMLTLFSSNLPATSYYTIWIDWVGPLIGGFLAGLLFRLTHPQEIDGSAKGSGATVKPAFTDYAIEFVGTFLLSFTVACAAAPSKFLLGYLAPLSIGSMLMAQVFAGGPTSGGHYNPAVTLAVYLRATIFGGDAGLPALKALGYATTQCIAGLLAGFLAKTVVLGGDIGFPMPAATAGAGVAWLCELVATFFLAFVVLQSATAKATAGNSFFGLSIGFTVLAMAVTVGGISGGAFNPAVGMLGVAGSMNTAKPSPWFAMLFIYPTACLVGGALAACTYRLTNRAEFETAVTEKTPLADAVVAP